jgi:hypothetical protein
MLNDSIINFTRRALISGVGVVTATFVINPEPTTDRAKIVTKDRWILKESDLF